jgi:hypothetical protein
MPVDGFDLLTDLAVGPIPDVGTLPQAVAKNRHKKAPTEGKAVGPKILTQDSHNLTFSHGQHSHLINTAVGISFHASESSHFPRRRGGVVWLACRVSGT